MAIHYDRRAIKRFMVARDLDRKELAQRARLAVNTIHYLCLGVTEPKASTLARIATVLEMPIEAFFVAKDKAA